MRLANVNHPWLITRLRSLKLYIAKPEKYFTTLISLVSHKDTTIIWCIIRIIFWINGGLFKISLILCLAIPVESFLQIFSFTYFFFNMVGNLTRQTWISSLTIHSHFSLINVILKKIISPPDAWSLDLNTNINLCFAWPKQPCTVDS